MVFTLPQALAPFALQNPKVVYDLLLRTAARTLQEIAQNPRHLGPRHPASITLQTSHRLS